MRALTLLYETTDGAAWRNNANWLTGEPCVDGWFGVHCCPRSRPILATQGDGTDVCTTDGNQATVQPTTQGSAACHSGNITGTALDLATCVVVKVLLPANNLVGSLDGALCGLPFLRHLDLSGNALVGSLSSEAECLPRLTSLDLTQARSWDDQGGISGRIPEWLLDRVGSMTRLRLANNAFDDPTAPESVLAIRAFWQHCSPVDADCSGVPPIGCSAFNRPGQRYEVELSGVECVRCPTPLEVLGLGCIVAGVVIFFAILVGVYTRFMRKYPEYAKTHVATIVILFSHFQTLTIIGSMQLGWPLFIKKILSNINLPLMGSARVPSNTSPALREYSCSIQFCTIAGIFLCPASSPTQCSSHSLATWKSASCCFCSEARGFMHGIVKARAA